MYRAYMLLSGGLDSTTLLYHTVDKHSEADVKALSVNYGQRHKIELNYATRSCAKLGIEHQIIDLSSIVPKTLLTDKNRELPNTSYAELPTGISPTYVPFRNGLMLSALASVIQGDLQHHDAWAEGKGLAKLQGEINLYYGAHAEDSANWAYPDCTPEFNGSMANAIFIGTYQRVRLSTPFQWHNKCDIVRRGHELRVPFEDSWSCYAGGEVHCGTCPTCRARKDAFAMADVTDPTEYAE